MIKFIIKKFIVIAFFGLYSAGTVYASIAQSPLFLTTSVDPNVLFNMSVETPMGGAAYNDQPNTTTGCTGRINDGGTVGICYFPAQKYLGYYDPNKCYGYSSSNGFFKPVSAANADHSCSGQFSGNFMNWASMTAMDMFVWTMTGGNRVDDGADNKTIIQRTRKTNNNAWFPHKLISSTSNVAPSTVTPWGDSKIYIYNTSFGIKFGTTRGGSEKGIFEAKTRVCNNNRGLEDNCVAYDGGSYYKPEGLVQENADHMRFGVTSYTNSSTNDVHGGVLRSNIKYVGSTMPDGSGNTVTNPLAEINTDGTINTNANPDDATASGVSLSGVISYINKFSESSYKGFDPASELFYESIRYFKNLGPTAEYLIQSNGASWDNGGFPMLGANRWQDPIQYSCQKNFIIGMNDAYTWRDKKLPGTYFTTSVGVDGNDYGQPSTPDTDINVRTLTNTVGWLQGFSPSYRLGEKMFSGRQNSHYIAGLAYYANTEDIRTGATGNLGPTTNFPNKQSITTFMIDSQEYSSTPSLGENNMLWLAGKYGGFTDENDDKDPNNGTPGTSTNEWDVNEDGEPDNYVLATEPVKLVAALSQVFTNIVNQTSSASAVATNSTRLDTNTKIYQARFSSSEWTGELLAYNLNSNGEIGTLVWDAANKIPAEISRNIYSYDPTATGTKGITLEYANLNAAQQALVNTNYSGTIDSLGAERINYIRGDTSAEGSTFRTRSSLMGDIINSDPWFSGTVEDFGYGELSGTEGTSYSAYRNAKLSRTPAVYFSSNDAMLHAINAENGNELFTFIPDALIGSLNTLSDPFYGCEGTGCITHRYFMDGAPRVADAYFGSAWHSVLVNTLAAGGKGLFALDVTSPSTFSVSKVLWEISTTQAPGPSSDLTDFSNNLGYTLPQASVVKMHDGSWAAVVANGYESASDKAVLYLIDIQTGHIIESLDTGVGSAGTPNGLSHPIAIDEDGDRITDSIYAGDLLGNLWKFDVSSNNSNNWDIAYKQGSTPIPLFKAVDATSTAQPITAKPQVGKHPDGGLMIYFGTGKYYADNDQIVGLSPQVQTFYGLRDSGSEIASRSSLQEQTISAEATITIPARVGPPATNAFNIDVRQTTDLSVDYSSQSGWFMELKSPAEGPEGERVVSAPLLRSGRIIFPTLIPDPNPCDSGGSSWLMELDALNGSRLSTSPFDINNDGNFDIYDYIEIYDPDDSGAIAVPTSGIRKEGLGIIKTPGVVICNDGTECKYSSGSSGELDMIKESTASPTGRQSWRQLR